MGEGKNVNTVSSEKVDLIETNKISPINLGLQPKIVAKGVELSEDIVVEIRNGAFGWKTFPVAESKFIQTKFDVESAAVGLKTAATKERDSSNKPVVEAEPELILRNINFSIRRETITAIIGPVGSGKSTLLKAILGEAPITQGTVQIASDDFALCEQTPWLVNGTIQRSILGTSVFNQEWYNIVIQACALEEDLEQLLRGDQTLVGSKGITLSGGQAQRIVSFFFLDDHHAVLLV